MAVFGWIGKRLQKIPEGPKVYNNVQPIAEGVKAILQIVIGLSSVVILITQLCIHLSESALTLGNRALAIIGVALAFSAVVELAYTFFTDGPDEAIDPLILGLSSFALIEISRSDTHLNTVAIPILLVTLAIVVLFVARRFLLEVRKKATANTGDTTPTDS
jgi:hypothetical protein